jgi:heptosyltransferase-1
MRVLLIKTSSMGDIIHTLPALTDAKNAITNIQFDWVVEETFAELPAWHPAVAKVIPVALRRFKKHIISNPGKIHHEWQLFLKQLRMNDYDLVLDAQGLVKSSLLACFAKGIRAGLDFRSARESLASFIYQRKYRVNFYQHAIVRMRSLFSLALDYPLPNTFPEVGIQVQTHHTQTAIMNKSSTPYLVFLHGTTWNTKEWPEFYWIELAELAIKAGYHIKISGGHPHEVARAYRIASSRAWVEVIPSLSISEMAILLSNAQGAIAVDTGFGHLAAAINVPTVSLYGATHPGYTGAIGKRSVHLTSSFPCAPCFSHHCSYRPSIIPAKPACYSMIPPMRVLLAIMQLIKA